LTKKSTLLLYAAATAAAVVVSFYARFPADDVGAYAARTAERLLPGLKVAVTEVRPSLPAAIRIRSIETAYRTVPLVEMVQARLAPAWRSVFGPDLVVDITAGVAAGRLRARLRIPKDSASENLTFSAEFDRVELAQIPVLAELLGRRVTGVCSGTAAKTADPGSPQIQIQLRLTDAVVALRQPILRRKEVSFQQVEAEASMTGSGLQIVQCTLTGDAFDGEVSGRIEWRGEIVNSGLDLQGMVKPHAQLLAELKQIVPAQRLRGSGSDVQIPFRLAGTLENPRYTVR
jgi:type II secretion system protein N